MTSIVGSKGQVVIAQEIRKHLGIGPGWLAVQSLVGDHVELVFVPPEHDRSLKGALSSYVGHAIQAGESWDQAREQAWNEAVDAKMLPGETMR